MEIVYAVIFSSLFAVSMKIAREIGEGKLQLFRGSGLFAGFLMGFFSSMVIVDDYQLANVWMAALAGWILRSKISHFYVALGATLMFLVFLFTSNELFVFDKSLFVIFFMVMAISGLLHDFLSEKGIMERKKSELIHSVIFYTVLPLYYSIYTDNWLIFSSLFSFMLSYEIARHYIYRFSEGQVKTVRKIASRRSSRNKIIK